MGDQNVAISHDGDPTTSTASITLDGSVSSDPDGDTLSYRWSQLGHYLGDWSSNPQITLNLTAGTRTYHLEVRDSYGRTSSDDVVITVAAEPNQAPVANAGPDQTLPATAGSATATLNGSGSSDPDGDALTYLWQEGTTALGSTASLTANLTTGTHTLTLTVTDSYGATATDTVVVNVGPIYSWSGVLQPIDPPNASGVSASVFKAGSTVPLRFALTGTSAGITTLAATLSYLKVSSGILGTDIEAVSTAAATTGNLFRYDPTTGQYIFNWSTKGLTAGTYRLVINLGDGVDLHVDVGLK